MPVIASAPCFQRFVEFDTTIKGTTRLLLAMAEINVIDCLANPLLKADLEVRCLVTLAGVRTGQPGVLPGTKTRALEYETEPVDTWQSFSRMAERSPKQTIRADCDCLAPLWAAFFHLRGYRAGVGISQPRMRTCCRGPACKDGTRCGHGMAHAYTLLRDGEHTRYFDGSVIGDMADPGSSFYGSGESAEGWL